MNDSPTPKPRLWSRRTLLRRAAWGGGATLGVGAVGTAFNERFHPRVRRVTVTLPTLPLALQGFTICQLSDLHLGPHVRVEYLRRCVEMAKSLKADLVALTGDYLSGYDPRDIHACGTPLEGLQARHGVYAVLGNHDYWCGDPEAVSASLRSAGAEVLVNRAVRITTQGTEWWLSGLDDLWGGKPDLDRTVQDVPAGAFNLLLCHAPDFADQAAKRAVPLQLSGHSHGGQVRAPGIGAFILPKYGRRYPAGLQRVQGAATQVYTNVGVGVIFPPIRLNCPPEITLLTLSRA